MWTVDTPQYQTAYFDFKSKLEEVVPTIYAIKSYFEYPTIVHSVSSDRKTVEVTARLKTTDTPIDISTYEKASNGSPLTIQFSGNDLINLAISNQLTKDLFVIETVGIPILLVALVLVFGGLMSIIAPVCLVLWSIAAALAILHGMAQLINVTNFATNATTIIGRTIINSFNPSDASPKHHK